MRKFLVIASLISLFILPVLAQDEVLPVGSHGTDIQMCIDNAQAMNGATMIGNCLCNLPGGWQFNSVYFYNGATASKGACSATYTCGQALATISVDGGSIKAGCSYLP